MTSPTQVFDIGAGYALGSSLIVGQPDSIAIDNSGVSSGACTLAYDYNFSTGKLTVTATRTAGTGFNSFYLKFKYWTCEKASGLGIRNIAIGYRPWNYPVDGTVPVTGTYSVFYIGRGGQAFTSYFQVAGTTVKTMDIGTSWTIQYEKNALNLTAGQTLHVEHSHANSYPSSMFIIFQED